ncbi:MAG: sigma-70 family RNA polymerase sigma factor [Pirellulales bacterium]
MSSAVQQHDRDAADPRRFIRLFVENERRIYAFIVSLLPRFNDAEDVLQETSLVLWQQFDQFEPGTDFAAWACRVAQLEVFKFYRKQGRAHLQLSPEAIAAVAESFATHGPLLESRQNALATCVEKLSSRDRDLLERRYVHAAPPKQIAAQVGRSIHAVYKALSRIHDDLMLCIQRKVDREKNI